MDEDMIEIKEEAEESNFYNKENCSAIISNKEIKI